MRTRTTPDSSPSSSAPRRRARAAATRSRPSPPRPASPTAPPARPRRPGAANVIRDTATPAGNAAATGSLANAQITNGTANQSPSTPSLGGPADGTTVATPTPTLSATFSDPDTQDTGTITFQLCVTSDCS